MTPHKCTKCLQVKTASDFYKEKRNKSGLASWCKSCKSHAHRVMRELFKNRPLIHVASTQMCWRCKEIKPHTEFGVSRSNKSGLNPLCKACGRTVAVVHNTEAVKRDPRRRKSHLWSKYRIRPDQYERMLIEQDGKCAICASLFCETPRVDHCHSTGTVRGLLCQRCNGLLAAFDLEGFMEKALEYLAKARVA